MTTAQIDIEEIKKQVRTIAEKAKAASRDFALLDSETKGKALLKMADAIVAAKSELIEANKKDVSGAEAAGRSKAIIDRLTLNEDRVKGIADGLKDMAKLEDPIGETLREWSRPSGIKIKQIRVPLGVVAMIYESRPNVTAESAGLCLKSGNAVILRGSKEAFYSNTVLARLISEALKSLGINPDGVQLLPPQDRRSITVLTQMNGLVDLVVARGSEEMIKEVSANATVPVMGHGKGVCHVYVDKAADVEKAVNIAFNSKVQRPGVCNAMETLLIHADLLYDVVPPLMERFVKAGVEVRGDDQIVGMVSSAKRATEEDWDKEYLDKILSIRVVNSLDEALEHIQKYGSGHTESIVTEDPESAGKFQKAVDSSCVIVNASTRLHDGGVFGFGSEIGISTNKLHARGTMGLRELTSSKFLVVGNGHIRE